MKLIAKKDTWFKEGSVVELLEEHMTFKDGTKSGLYRGVYIIGNSDYDKFWYSFGYKEGDEVVMNEECTSDEFEFVE